MARRKPPPTRRRRGPTPPGPEPGHLQSWLSRPGAACCEAVPADRLGEAVGEPGAVLWVDVHDPGEADLERLRKEFGFHRLALDDVARQQQRPKVDTYPDHYFVVLYAPVPTSEPGEVHTSEVDLFVGRNYVVTLHRGEIPALAEAVARWERTEPDMRRHCGFLVHTIADAVIDAYFPIVDQLEDRLDDLEIGVFEGGETSAEELLAVKRSLLTLRKAIYPMREVFNTFLSRDGHFDEATIPYFQDVYDHVLRLLDVLDIQRDMATGTLDAHLAVVSNRLNDTMRRLTTIGVCVTVMGAVFGAWGMNFDRIPLAHEPLGFWIVSVGVALLVAAVLVWIRWRRPY